jgi:exonuclease III
MKKLITVILSLVFFQLVAQDTLKVMQYNLLMYGNNSGWCNANNNDVDEKNQHLQTIIDYVKPDIFTVNELSDNTFYHEYLLSYALNVEGVNYYQMGTPSNLSGSYIVNQVYYNGDKLGLDSYKAVSTVGRDIDIFKLYYILPGSNDTAFINCVVAHLKAGNSSEDALQRTNETNSLMNYLSNSNASGNYLMMGDFNVYRGTEDAFENLLYHNNQSIRFYDPIDKVGSWNNNSYYASIHTQSTHTSSGGCPSSGGMDDRFDFILTSDEVLYGTDKARFVPGSYKALGQDGQHFNSALIDDPVNTTVPADVNEALYYMSDHLPIVMDLMVGNNVGTEELAQKNPLTIKVANPFSDEIKIHISSEKPEFVTVDLFNLQGKLVYSNVTKINQNANLRIPVSSSISGMYLLRIRTNSGFVFQEKLMKF